MSLSLYRWASKPEDTTISPVIAHDVYQIDLVRPWLTPTGRSGAFVAEERVYARWEPRSPMSSEWRRIEQPAWQS